MSKLNRKIIILVCMIITIQSLCSTAVVAKEKDKKEELTYPTMTKEEFEGLKDKAKKENKIFDLDEYEAEIANAKSADELCQVYEKYEVYAIKEEITIDKINGLKNPGGYGKCCLCSRRYTEN